MGTAQKRIMVTPSPEMEVLLDRYCDLSGRRKSSVVRDFLENMHHPLTAVVDALEILKIHPEQILPQLINLSEIDAKHTKQLVLYLKKLNKPSNKRARKILTGDSKNDD